MRNMNELIRQIPPDKRGDKRDLKLLVIRPSVDLGALAYDLKEQLPPTFRYLMGRFGAGQVRSQDFLSTVLFDAAYIERLMEIGEMDGDSLGQEMQEFFES